MIVDRLDNWQIYFKKPIWETIFAELKALNEKAPAMEKKIRGDDIILKVFSYETADPASDRAELETHKKYIDIHTTITNVERIDWYPSSVLKTIKPYDENEDAEYYAKPDLFYAGINMVPGIFAVFWPSDAHMPGLQVAGKTELIKKAVMKISIDLAC